MSRVRIFLKTPGLDEMIDALADLRTTGIQRAQRELDKVLQSTFRESQALAHISHDRRHSGALKASGATSSEHGPTHWVGEISYADRGAQFELQRGGDHAAFIDGLDTVNETPMLEAIYSIFRDL